MFAGPYWRLTAGEAVDNRKNKTRLPSFTFGLLPLRLLTCVMLVQRLFSCGCRGRLPASEISEECELLALVWEHAIERCADPAPTEVHQLAFRTE